MLKHCLSLQASPAPSSVECSAKYSMRYPDFVLYKAQQHDAVYGLCYAADMRPSTSYFKCASTSWHTIVFSSFDFA